LGGVSRKNFTTDGRGIAVPANGAGKIDLAPGIKSLPKN
jgi:hypothetical protein